MNIYHIIHAHQLCSSTHSTSWWNYYRPLLPPVLASTDFGSIITILKMLLNLLKSFKV